MLAITDPQWATIDDNHYTVASSLFFQTKQQEFRVRSFGIVPQQFVHHHLDHLGIVGPVATRRRNYHQTPQQASLADRKESQRRPR
mmetsp:Transcript_18315/g.33208  ORF Transcript_18315/g.33208 Transcript_18315/m.33208 type:complete len:86 (-) Transcript_18315:720-977(-)